jgi:RNA polymerase sigma-70 factor (ECF subfamily)
MAVATLPAAGQPRMIEDARAGDQRAFALLLRQHDERMRGLAWKLLGDRDRMDDALQEAYVKAWCSLGTFRSDASFGTWLYRIAYNACMDELRRGARRPTPQDWTDTGQQPAVTGAGPERQVVASETVLRLLASLPEDQRAAVVLVDSEGFDNQTAADILGVAVGTVASRLSRARATLRASLGREDR